VGDPPLRDTEVAAGAGAAEAAVKRVVVVGASLAGLRAVEALRQAGYEGRLTLVGREQHLPYDRPPLSKQVLAGAWEADRIWLREPEAFADLDLDLRLGTAATGLDVDNRRVDLEGGEGLPYDGLVIATGAAPRTLPGQPTDLAGLHVLRTLEDCLAIREGVDAAARVVVVGAGFIGAEVAATARGRGCQVTVLEALPVPLSRGLGPVMGAACAALHSDNGVDLRCEVGVASIEADGSGRVAGVRLQSGETVAADLVVVGIGVSPVTAWLEGSGLRLNDGVVCDEACAAGPPGVYAAGDVARWPNPLFGEEMRLEHWTNAVEQATHVAHNLLAGAGATPFAPVPYFWSDQYTAKIQFVGRSGPDDEVKVVHGTVDERKFVALYGRAGRLVGALGFSMPRLLMGYRALIAERASWEAALEHASSVG
jgi:NADPH-dependent 2,4-dienoyl-CoA reductase/sulfur reductase-like enzyme